MIRFRHIALAFLAIGASFAFLGMVSAQDVLSNLGALPPGKSVRVTFDATVDNPFPAGIMSVTQQGTVTADGGINVLTDDPDVGGAADPTVTSIDDPCIINCPADITVSNDAGTCGAVVTFATPTTTGPCGPVSCNPMSGATFAVGTTPVICSEPGGATCTFNVTVNDTEDPVISCPANVTIECASDSSSTGTGTATASDNCASVTVTESDSVAAGTCAQEEVITRTWTATDASGNSATCDQTITVVDTTAPVITCPADATVECSDDSSSAGTGVASATDNCDPAPVVTESDSMAAGACPQEKVITRTWTATDECGNSATCEQTITVVDTTDPVITCPADATVECSDDSSSAGTGVASAVDNCDATPTITESDSVAAGTCPQEKVITRTWTATDDCGNATSCDQTITVVDTTNPVITCPVDVTVECSDDMSSASTGMATATDNCDATPTITESDSVTAGTCPQEKVITRTWTATDDCGNATSCDQTITVVDTTNPVITCPADITVECTDDPSSAGTGIAAATDNCDATPTITESDSVAAGTCLQEEVITRTWTATDDCGNATSCDQIITVEDTTAPSINCPPPMTLECPADTSIAANGSATGNEFCGSVTITSSDAVTPGCGNTETVVRTWTATDECGNSTSCDQTITVVDTMPPIINCPPPVTLECPADTSIAANGSATASDICGSVTITSSDISVPVCGNTEIITRTWTATDECGLAATCDQTITVVDTMPPIVNCPP